MNEIIPSWDKAETKCDNRSFFTNQYRFLICGSSGDGKTVTVNRLLLAKTLDYTIIFLYTPSLQQASYQIMISGMTQYFL